MSLYDTITLICTIIAAIFSILTYYNQISTRININSSQRLISNCAVTAPFSVATAIYITNTGYVPTTITNIYIKIKNDFHTITDIVKTNEDFAMYDKSNLPLFIGVGEFKKVLFTNDDLWQLLNFKENYNGPATIIVESSTKNILFKSKSLKGKTFQDKIKFDFFVQ